MEVGVRAVWMEGQDLVAEDLHGITDGICTLLLCGGLNVAHRVDAFVDECLGSATEKVIHGEAFGFADRTLVFFLFFHRRGFCRGFFEGWARRTSSCNLQELSATELAFEELVAEAGVSVTDKNLQMFLRDIQEGVPDGFELGGLLIEGEVVVVSDTGVVGSVGVDEICEELLVFCVLEVAVDLKRGVSVAGAWSSGRSRWSDGPADASVISLDF